MGIVASEDVAENAETTEAAGNIIDATAAFAGTAYHYYHGNERMDVEYITDEAGQVVNGYTYDAFGTIVTSSEKLQNRYTYNGEAFDKTTEQYYLRKRFYNPKLSRFIQEDEYRGDGLNLYAFCANNPVMYVDPSGYKGENSDSTTSWNDFQSSNAGQGYTRQQMSDMWSQYKMDNGIGDHYLHRPYIRQKTRDGIKGNRYSDGVSGEAIVGQVDIGHKYDHEFWRCRNAAEALGMTQSEFNDYMNQSELYRYEEHSENISHAREDKNPDITKKKQVMEEWLEKRREESGNKCNTG